VNTLIPEDPAAERFEALVAALGNPTLSAYEAACLARIVSWSSDEDIAVLARLAAQARSDAFDLGRLNAQAEAEGRAPSRSLAGMVLIPARAEVAGINLVGPLLPTRDLVSAQPSSLKIRARLRLRISSLRLRTSSFTAVTSTNRSCVRAA
jgi:hypothetical protein